MIGFRCARVGRRKQKEASSPRKNKGKLCGRGGVKMMEVGSWDQNSYIRETLGSGRGKRGMNKKKD